MNPTFELVVNTPREPGSEEYLDSEKYQVRHWDHDQPQSLRPLVSRVNAIRRAHPALQHDGGLRFLPTDNEQILAYSRTSPDGLDTVLCVVNLDPWNPQSGWFGVDADARAAWGTTGEAFTVHDELSGGSYTWGSANFVSLHPWGTAAHVCRLEREVGA